MKILFNAFIMLMAVNVQAKIIDTSEMNIEYAKSNMDAVCRSLEGDQSFARDSVSEDKFLAADHSLLERIGNKANVLLLKLDMWLDSNCDTGCELQDIEGGKNFVELKIISDSYGDKSFESEVEIVRSHPSQDVHYEVLKSIECM